MKDIDELKDYCIQKMTYHREMAEGAHAAGKPVVEASNRGACDAIHGIYSKLCIYFRQIETVDVLEEQYEHRTQT